MLKRRVIFLVGPRPRRWEARVLEMAATAGYDVAAQARPAEAASIPGLDLLLQFERLVHGVGPCALDPVPLPNGHEAQPGGDTAVEVDLTGGAERVSRTERLRPLYEGSPDPAELVGALLARRTPRIDIELTDADGSRSILSAAIAIADRRTLSRALNEACARVATLLLRALNDMTANAVLSSDRQGAEGRCSVSAPRLLAFGVAGLADAIAGRLLRLAAHPEHWRVAYRRIDGDGVLETFKWPATAFTPLPDDGARFYADPFVITDEGRTHVFVEEFPYATGKGLLSHFEISPDGRAGTPRPVLESACHLSYPQVFRHDGQIYMIPETSGARRIELYRADPFPLRWTLDSTLVENVEASDVTLFRHEGRFWLFASLSDGGCSSWDALGLFFADSLRGPWRAHPRNPVLFDARAARPAGAMALRNGAVLRVAQDCSSRYGGGMTICAIEQLDPTTYAQKSIVRLGPPPGFSNPRTHTLNRSETIEVIDLCGPTPLPGVRRLIGGDGVEKPR